ncbi:MAG: AmmeMemoRadiSam system protein B [Deltaproteobacteria bacterium]|nr:AmmeMemoRadiSam system protein B [Deltaproteobacteria bacterium]MBW2136513.1 AmmeMemoRadiSam system protein B [Deltaproteobacteria bacterium]
MAVRKADFAGSWYPGRADDCRQAIEEFCERGLPCPSSDRDPVGGIVPHAGWFYSGSIACNVVRCLRARTKTDTVVVIGRHLHPGSGNYIMSEGMWATPLGDLEIDRDLADGLVGEFKFNLESPTRYEPDNTIELQLPFIKYFFPEVRVLPLGVPPAADSLAIGTRVVELAGSLGKNIIVLGSTDLTHYGYNYGYSPKGSGRKAVEWVKNENDKKVVDLMLKMDAQGVIRESLKSLNACCSGAAATAIEAARRLGATKGYKLDYYTSYDVRPDDSFVGYVGIVFS